MKKKLLVLILAIISVFMVSSCQDDEVDNPLIQGDVVHITIAHPWGAEKAQAQKDLIDGFIDMMKYEHGVTVIVDMTSKSASNWDTLLTQTNGDIKNKKMPNIVLGYPDHFVQYIDAGKMLCLDNYINNEEFGLTNAQIDDFNEGFLAENNQYNGKYYSLPYVKSTEIMFYNKTMVNDLTIDGVKVSIPHDSAVSWAYLSNIWEKAKNSDGKTLKELGYQRLASFDSGSNLFINFFRQLNANYTSSVNGGKFYVDDSENIGASKYVLTLIETFFQKSIIALPSNFDSNAEYASTYFKNGDMLFTIGSTAGITYNLPDGYTTSTYGGFDVGVALVPQFDGTTGFGGTTPTNAVVQQGPDIGILKSKDEAENFVSWLFIKYATTSEIWDTETHDYIEGSNANAQLAYETTYFPVTKSALESDTYKDFLQDAIDYYDGKTVTTTRLNLIKSMVAYCSLKTVQSTYLKYDEAFCKSSSLWDSAKIRAQVGETIKNLSTASTTATALTVNVDDEITKLADKCRR